ncbi:MAG TPA: glycosyltransferase family 2 protein, partial [Gemmatimonadales bacterium]|nr:glycosyltransferase family 2 protein [Gemmatimonadales bacterium]
MRQPRVSVGIPLFNEEQGVPELIRRVGAALDGIPGGPHEIVCVDDGSRDGTVRVLEQAAGRERRLKVVALSRNFGHQTALTAALDHVTGDVVVVMDGDLQDPPEEIARFLKHYAEGYDVVYAMRVGRKESWWL